MGFAADDRAVNQRETTLEAARKQAGVLVFGREQTAQAGERAEVLRDRQRDDGSAFAEGDVGDGKLLLLFEPDDSRILQAPALLVAGRIGGQRRLGIDGPFGQAVGTAGDRQMREASHILHADQQKGLITEPCGGRVEDGVGGIGPVLRLQDGIALESCEQFVGFLLSFES